MSAKETAEVIAREFHETYERLAPDYGYETREASAVPWDDVPDSNRLLMIAVCSEVVPKSPKRRGKESRNDRIRIYFLFVGGICDMPDFG